jgi:very-short-patch-repair endonuclease
MDRIGYESSAAVMDTQDGPPVDHPVPSGRAREFPLDVARRITPERQAVVERAVDHWTKRLIDRTRRNRLLYFLPSRGRTVELTEDQAIAALPLIDGTAVDVRRIFGKMATAPPEDDRDPLEDVEEPDPGVVRRLRLIQGRGDEDYEERGLETVYLAYGMASWTGDGTLGRGVQAPVLMVPIRVEGRVGRMKLQPRGDLEINVAFVNELEERYGCTALNATLEATTGPDSPASPAKERAEAILTAVQSAAAGVPGFSLTRAAVIDNFAFQKLAIVRDLQHWSEQLAEHDVIAALAGDGSTRARLLRDVVDVDPRELDSRRPDREHLVLDADSSQHRAIAAIVRGQSGVIIGPPGTGKSQTSATLICELVANGKTVLFVAEKRAALDVIQERLPNSLGALVLDLHGAASRKQVLGQFAAALDAVHEALAPPAEELHREFAAQRTRLNSHADLMHRPRAPSGLSAYTIMGRLLELRGRGAASGVRWRGAELATMVPGRIEEIEEALVGAAGDPDLLLRTSRSPWTNAALEDESSVAHAVRLAEEILHRLWPELDEHVHACVSSLQVRRPTSLAGNAQLLGALQEADRLLADWSPDVFDVDLAGLARRLMPARTPVTALLAWLTSGDYRAAKREAHAVRRTRAGGRRLLGDMQSLLHLTALWETMAEPGRRPEGYDTSALKSSHDALRERLGQLGRYIGLPAETEPADQLRRLLADLVSDRRTAVKIPHLRRYELRLELLGAGPYVRELRDGATPVNRWTGNLRYAWLSSCLDDLQMKEPGLGFFNGRNQDRIVEEFRRLDKVRLHLAVDRVLRAYAERAVATLDAHPKQQADLKWQIGLQRQQLPLRELVRQAPDVVTALKPCWMASPLAVSQMLGRTQCPFDVVVFDEASQVPPEDAVTSLVRGRSVVVAGDPHQLPPTWFFAADREHGRSDEESIQETLSGFDSVLEVLGSFLPKWNLNWHYRSRDERLIAFSNQYVYGNDLVTFPSSGGGPPPLDHVLVPQSRATDAEAESASAEVEHVVELIIQHAELRPESSLGVIAFGDRHAERIERVLERARRDRRELEGFFEGHPEQRFFIKNLERVQGDERDVIILSVGYGRAAGGRLLHRFGPLARENGYRRLNVAVTRARVSMIVVSSFGHEEMDPVKSRHGVDLLRRYLAYAATGGASLPDAGPTAVAPNDFESDVQRALVAAGMPVVAQYGASGYRIDLVIAHPQKPGRYLLAIECDGAAYHSMPTARDRDRLRQENLQRRGWRFVRIWSTDWFTHRDAEVARVAAAYEEALQAEAAGPEANPDGHPAQADDVPRSEPRRARRPPVPRGLRIADYSDSQLDRLARWIRSDGRLRTEQEVTDELFRDLAFQRRTSKIMQALQRAVERSGPSR